MKARKQEGQRTEERKNGRMEQRNKEQRRKGRNKEKKQNILRWAWVEVTYSGPGLELQALPGSLSHSCTLGLTSLLEDVNEVGDAPAQHATCRAT